VAPGVVEGLVSSLLKILGAGTLAFMTLAMAQEWTVFDQAWFGSAKNAPELPETERKAASDAVYATVKVMEHVYSSGGDPRFLERMPASDAVLEEIRADIDYLRLNQRRQEISLDRLDVMAIHPVSAHRVEIQTREIWSVRVDWIGGGEAAEPAAQRLVHGTYRLSRGARGWRVQSWEPSEPWRESESSERRGDP
jgi:hypothetical protein